ncbi:CIA30-domain-containing protein [Lindgomyces ingoldianus]|uniref:CIA30-domain-containing protein n=1 Tax=Lindgomyces ingoldianus TaxID=673940 RepID=A0ACB6QYZ3_9PLEO|nr:CIA30-domain-containing protein [Lindgomyces ingoldianus]KAF2472141.1 CIA30-domain-containing protein [Lindgomyces ingoldianus]
MGKMHELTLFGGDKDWKQSDWTASDDRVRGGTSQSYLECIESKASFHGILDIQTLGGAGFASQRTTGDDRSWDLSDYDGIKIELGGSDGKKYTFIMKDELLPKNPADGREQATTSYEFDFIVSSNAASAKSSFIFIPWEDFKPTYRGKEKDAPKLNKKDIRRISIMMRSFFGDQEGNFSLTLKSIKAVSLPADLEEGFVAKKQDSLPVQNWEDGHGRFSCLPTPRCILVCCIVAFGACRFLYPWILTRYQMWPFNR